MRIVLLTHQWPGVRLGGIGVYTLNCARALAEAGHDVHVVTLTLPEDVRAAIPEGFTVHEVRDLAERVQDGSLPGPLAAAVHAGGEGIYRLALGALLCGKVRELHLQKPFDLLEAPEYEGLALPLIVSPIADLPIIVQLHSGSAIVRRASGLEATADQLLFEAMELACVLGADSVCAPSAKVVRDTQEDCAFEGATICPLPFYPVVEAVAGAPAQGGPILFIGRLEAIKGAHLLAEALNIFLPRFPGASVRLVGPDTTTAPGGGSMRRWIAAKLDPAIAGRVSFVGEKTRVELAAELANASFVLVPSLFDSYSYVCCEALAAGRAVIVSDNVGATEVVGEAGLTFRRDDAGDLARVMERLYGDRPLLLELSRRAHDRASTTLATASTIGARLAYYASVIRQGPQLRRDDSFSGLPPVYTRPLLQALARLTTFLAGAPDPANKTPGLRLLQIMNDISAGTHAPAKVLLYGAGRHTSRLLAEKHLWESAGHEVVGLIDDHPRFATAKTHLNLPVQSVMQLLARLPLADRDVAVVLSTDSFQEQFWRQTEALRDAGMRVFCLY